MRFNVEIHKRAGWETVAVESLTPEYRDWLLENIGEANTAQNWIFSPNWESWDGTLRYSLIYIKDPMLATMFKLRFGL